jgi:hypothetical protein
MPRTLKQGRWFRTKNPKHYEVYRDRNDFLEALNSEAPSVLESLYNDVLPLWRMAYLPAYWAAMDNIVALNEACDTRCDLPMIVVRDWLVAWSAEFHLNATWIHEAAIRTLYFWMRRSQRPQRLRWAPEVIVFEEVETKGALASGRPSTHTGSRAGRCLASPRK